MEIPVSVEVHPWSVSLPPEFRRWRVMLDGQQHSVHESEAEADATAAKLRLRLSDGWSPAAETKGDSTSMRGDWKR